MSIKATVKNGSPYINDRRCSFQNKKIRRTILSFAETNKSFFLPKKYTFEVTELNGFAKIIKNV